MEGTVSPELELTVRLTLVGVNNREEEIDAQIDTGFNGDLSLPKLLLDSLRWPYKHEQGVELGDASKTTVKIYREIVLWNHNPRLVSVVAAESTPFIGTAMLSGNELKVEFKRGGKISITPLLS